MRTTKINGRRNENNIILFQGDSWAEVIVNNKKVNNLISKFAVDNNYSIISSGKASFSLSLYF